MSHFWASPFPPPTNLLINPNGAINQRAPTTNADDTYGHDRWYALTQSNPIAVSTVSDPEDGTPYMWRLTQSNASAQRAGYAQIVEAANCKHLRGQPVVLSGRVRLSSSANIRYAILEWTGTADSVTSDVVNDWTSSTYTTNNFFINSASLTVRAVGSMALTAATLTDLSSLTATLGSTFNNLIVMMWTEGTAAQNVTLDGALEFTLGTVKPTYRSTRLIGLERQLCKRYCRVLGGRALFEPLGFGGARTATTAFVTLDLGVEMRGNPVVTFSAAGDFLMAGSAFTTVTSISAPDVSPDCIGVSIGATGMTPDAAFTFYTNNTLSARITIDAEL
jgi:hypothetical protein